MGGVVAMGAVAMRNASFMNDVQDESCCEGSLLVGPTISLPVNDGAFEPIGVLACGGVITDFADGVSVTVGASAAADNGAS